jgi:hypothetical protein
MSDDVLDLDATDPRHKSDPGQVDPYTRGPAVLPVRFAPRPGAR